MIDPDTKTTVLANGLTVTTIHLPHVHTTSVALFWKVGSRFETPQNNGLSHFLEHMLFRGTEKHPSSLALRHAAEHFGAHLDAETGPDLMKFSLEFLPGHFVPMLHLLAQVAIFPAFYDIESERDLVLTELAADFDGGVEMVVDDIARGLLFKGQPIGQRIIGTKKNIRRFTIGDVRAHHKRYCGAGNASLCIAGPTNPASVMNSVENAFALTWQCPRAEPLPVAASSPKKRVPFRHVPSTDKVEICIAIRGVAEWDTRFAAQLVLGMYLDGALHYALADQRGLAYDVGAEVEPLGDTSVIDISMEVAPARVKDAVDVVFDVLYGFMAVGYEREAIDRTSEEARARMRFRLATAAAMDRPSLLTERGGSLLYWDAPLLSERIEAMERVTTADIQALLRDLLVNDRVVIAAVGGRSLTLDIDLRRP